MNKYPGNKLVVVNANIARRNKNNIFSGINIFQGDLFIENIKSGSTQANAGAAANELWKTSGHATLPDNVIMIGV